MARANRILPRNQYAPLVEAIADGYDAAGARLAPIADLAARLWLAQTFLVSGIVKLSSWPTTIALYAAEHPVPGLAPASAAVLGTGIELLCPPLLAVGLMTRLAAVPLFATAAFLQFTYLDLAVHWYWMLALGLVIVRGPGPISLDRAVASQLSNSALPLAGAVVRALAAVKRFGDALALTGLRVWFAVLAWSAAEGRAADWSATVAMFGAPGDRPYYPAEALAGFAIGLEFLVAGLLAAGLFTRLAAVVLAVAVVGLPYSGGGDALSSWRLLLLAPLALGGAGALSLDHLIRRAAERMFPSLISDPSWLSEAPRVVIVGAGFGGLAAALGLRHAWARITLVDRRNYHLFQPLLYQVATASLSPADIATPIRRVLRTQPNCRVVMGRVTGVDAAAREVVVGKSRIPFDYLVLATGAKHSYFGKDAWEPFAPGLKKIDDATAIRHRLLAAFERAETAEDEAEKTRLLTFVVVGGGPTGVELAGAIAELARHGMAGEFRTSDPSSARIVLIQAAPRLLPAMPERLSAAARRDLGRLGVEVLLNSRVGQVDEAGVVVDGRRIETRNVLWAAGVAASEAGRWLAAGRDPAGRIKVDGDFAVPGHDRIYAIGDTAACPDGHGGMLPGLAPVAKQQGAYVARVIRADVESRRPPAPFRYVDLGTMATIGRSAAVADLRGIRLAGVAAWWLWGFVHVALLVDVRNRAAVLLDWFWSYLTFNRRIRLITGAED
jgi:NADH dehydrogenase/putative oxidoreductase